MEKSKPKLVRPSVKYKKSFLEDFLPHDEMQDEYILTGVPKAEIPKRFAEFIKKLRLQSKGVFAREGLVPQSVFWLVKGNNFLGKTSIRHRLNEHLRKVGGHIGYYIRPDQRGRGYGKLILKLGLRKAKILGIKDVLITCDLTNTRSKNVIETNGGVLQNKISQGKNKPTKLRFVIKNRN